MTTQVQQLLSNPDLRTALTGVAKTIANPPPAWLIAGLEHFSHFISGDPITSEEQKGYDQIIARMHDAAAYLTKFLPLYSRMPLGLISDDVAVALQVLPRIKDDLARSVNMPKRKPSNRPRKTCATVVIEAWRIVHSRPKPESDKVWTACNEYWQACGREYRGSDVDTWREDCREAVAVNHEWIRQIFLALKNRT